MSVKPYPRALSSTDDMLTNQKLEIVLMRRKSKDKVNIITCAINEIGKSLKKSE